MEPVSPSKGQAMMTMHRDEAAAPEVYPKTEINKPCYCPKKDCDDVMYYRDEGDTLICFSCGTTFECSREELRKRLGQ